MTMRNSCRILRSLNISITSKRTLFSESYLGLEKYKIRKAEEPPSPVIKEKFENLSKHPELRVLTHDIKKFIYLIHTEEDFQIFSDLFERYAKVESDFTGSVKFQIFNLGPEVLRVYYAMNKPIEALALLEKPHTFSLICNLRSLYILQDLLYENGLYQEVCNIFDIVKTKQFDGKIFHFAPYVLYQAACYKMDTPDSYNNVMAMYNKFIKHNSTPDWHFLMYTLMFALKNSSLDIPLKHAVGYNPVCVNIKLSALIKSGSYSDALMFCDTIRSKSFIMKSVAEDLCKSLENDETKKDESLMNKLEKFREQIGKENLTDKTLDELAANVVHNFGTRKNKVQLDL